MNINDNLNNLMKEAQKMQQRMQEAQQQLSELKVVGEAGGGMLKITMTGRHDVVAVEIKPGLLDEDPSMIGDLIMAAVNSAVRKVEEASKEKISKLTAGLNIPTDFMKKKEDEE